MSGKLGDEEIQNKPHIYNLTLTDANSEYSQVLPLYVDKLEVKCRAAADIQLSFEAGQSGSTFWTIPAGASYWEDLIQGISGHDPVTHHDLPLTLYVQSATAGVVVEIKVWA